MAIDLSNYRTVPERIAEFREKHPEGSLQPLNPAEPYTIETIGNATFIVYAAVAHRGPDDKRPGIGLAWEPFPGKTSYTRDSELQNAETSAWGRAIVAALASDTVKGIASAEEVRNRSEADDDDWGASPAELGNPYRAATLKTEITSADVGRMRTKELAARLKGAGLKDSGSMKEMRDRLTDHLLAGVAPDTAQDAGDPSDPLDGALLASPDDAPVCPGCLVVVDVSGGPVEVGQEGVENDAGKLWHVACWDGHS